MKKIAVIALVFIALTTIGLFRVNAGLKKLERSTDYKCLNECLSAGYTYGYCQSLCSY